ncbi:MAG TPA: hypothetical protein VNK04_05245, partial [Gemmataceae bacterium]|nr:hypothetical protein [Gemmataceae bacterium]
MKRRIKVVFCVILVLAAPNAPRSIAPARQELHLVDVREETWEKVHVGMYEKEIEGVLGGPPGDYRTDKEVCYHSFNINMASPAACTVKAWLFDHHIIQIGFDSDGKAVYILRTGRMPPPT